MEQLVKSLRDAERAVCTEEHELDCASKKEELKLDMQSKGNPSIVNEPLSHSGMESAKLLSNKATQVESFSEVPSSRDLESGAAAVGGTPGQKPPESPKVSQEFYLRLKKLLEAQQAEQGERSFLHFCELYAYPLEFLFKFDMQGWQPL